MNNIIKFSSTNYINKKISDKIINLLSLLFLYYINKKEIFIISTEYIIEFNINNNNQLNIFNFIIQKFIYGNFFI